MKNILKGIVITGLLILSFVSGYKANSIQLEKNNNASARVEVEKIYYQSSDDFYLEPGEIGVTFTNGSWLLVNDSTMEYIFQPIELGDWDYQANTLDELKKVVSTYLDMKNL